jgi:hypothetical protein
VLALKEQLISFSQMRLNVLCWLMLALTATVNIYSPSSAFLCLGAAEASAFLAEACVHSTRSALFFYRIILTHL